MRHSLWVRIYMTDDITRQNYSRIKEALNQSTFEKFLRESSIERAKVIDRKHILEVKVEKKDLEVVEKFLDGYSVQFKFELKELKPWEARLTKLVFIKKWDF
jgi:hypothetical protein